MAEALVQVAGRVEPLRIRVNGDDPTFRLATDRITKSTLSPMAPLLEDLLDIACVVFAADSSVARGGGSRGAMGAGWKRQFGFTIPVRHPEVWSRLEVTEALANAVGFLTGDAVGFDFVAQVAEAPRQAFLNFDPARATFAAEDVILFSGGLDSFAGALERLSTSEGNVILLSHRSAQKVVPRQIRLANYLSKHFPKRVLHLSVAATRVRSEGVEPTQRSRSFLFAALGQAVAASFGASQVSFYENGIVSHNLPISPQVVGTMATRTTHPETLASLNVLMRLLLPQAAPIRNAYQWMTKTDVVTRIAQYGGTDWIGKAVSCTSVRDQDTLRTHCGRCSQCLDRRFAILAAGLDKHDSPEAYATDVLFGARDTDQSQTMAIEWVRHARRLHDMDDQAFLTTFGTEMTRIMKGHPDLDRKVALQLSCDMHRRHSASVTQVLETAVRERAREIVALKLPATSLLRMHVGDSAVPLAERTRPDTRPAGSVILLQDADIVLDPAGPLVVAFLRDDQRSIVAIRGLGRLKGRTADLAHGLKPTYDADRANGLVPCDHRFVEPRDILLSGKAASKAVIRQCVKRCRTELDGLYRDVFGTLPPKPLLIETCPKSGYRLDPTMRLTTQSDL